MRKRLLPLALVAAIVVAVVLIAGRGGNDTYLVRAIFDNGGFLVEQEEVRVAGATVGTIESVGVTMPGEIDSYEDGEWNAVPGKAVIVMRIDDPGFQDFRQDASCLIRPQSLIGEKFIDCRPTLPRAPGSEPAPPLRVVPDGEPGAGQHLLPFENNSTSVDPDLINNIGELPYAQRFRLILNELGASLAGRGEDLQEIVKRANPALRDVERLLGILNDQRDQLAQLASDSDQILEPLARERSSVAGFFSNAGATAEASAEKGEALEASLQRFPKFLRELRKTLADFEGFSDAATPVVASLGDAAPALTRATKALTPFSAASTVSLKALGATGEVAGPKLRETLPVVRKATTVARSGAGPITELAELLQSTTDTGGFDALVDLIYNGSAAINEFDSFGHMGRAFPALVNCIEYVTYPTSGCSANFNGEFARDRGSISGLRELFYEIQEKAGAKSGGTSADLAPVKPLTQPPAQAKPAPAPKSEGGPELGESEALGVSNRAADPRRGLLDYLLGP